MVEQLIGANDVDLCVETFGEPTDPAILLNAGQSSSMDWWDAGLCRRLAEGHRFVIRYDYRDTGRSTGCPPDEPDYSFADLVDDAFGVLDALDVPAAHWVGISMGGALVQYAALEHPDRVLSLTLVDTTAAAMLDVELPPPAPELQERFAAEHQPLDWSDQDAVIEHSLTEARALMGDNVSEEALRDLLTRVAKRTTDLRASMVNHRQMREGRPMPGTLDDITAPTLVIHGTADRLFPIEHGEALAAVIPGAALLALEGVGHETPPESSWGVVVPTLLRHTASS